MNVKRYDIGTFGDMSMESSSDGAYVRHDDYAALEARCAALAAENAGLKEWSPNPHSASMFEAIEKAEKLMDDGMPELAMVEAFEILKMQHTPATDAFLAEVRAQGVEMFAKYCQKRHGEMMKTEPNEAASNQAISATRRAGEFALYFAAQLRKGSATEEGQSFLSDEDCHAFVEAFTKGATQ
ncbi:hypothetical protein N8X72_01030 [Enterobacter hormaechei subsp. hoffmannii]|uniref:hypothetical protein n=1 Tax=Enterobacter hormaechei TaxID=158836 RepID=UPI0018ECBD09|nr:hypothetical protein [Enterobacter hormaechei]MBJ6567634.1 hypothetical protein [Enterobacter hormaechei]MCU3020077.1 hypothetical protein [Enterobacter hormaechei subsp. hoffmannii]MCU4004921.1 hypothetical protein [Enterobacter hormaechei subsp. hoffmannii]